MKTMSTADLKAHFSDVITELKNGNEVAITYGRNKTPLGRIIPQSKLQKPDYSIKLGDLQKQGWTYSEHDFDMTDQELIGL